MSQAQIDRPTAQTPDAVAHQSSHPPLADGPPITPPPRFETAARVLPLLALVLLLAFLLAPFWSQQGLPTTADGPIHLYRAAAIERAHESGLFWVRWFPEVYQGLGSPVFHYYAQFLYQLISLIGAAGSPTDVSTKIVLSLAYFISASALLSLLKRAGNWTAALVGIAIYFSQPLFYREFYFQGDYPQWFALLWLPVLLWALVRLYDTNHWFNWGAVSIASAVLIISHNITVITGTGFLILFFLSFHWAGERSWHGLMRVIAAALGGVGLSAFFWMPAILDMPLTYIRGALTGSYRYYHHFVKISDLLALPPKLDGRAGTPLFPPMLGMLAWGGSLIALVVLIRSWLGKDSFSREQRGLITAGLITAAVLIMLTTSPSAPVWDRLLPLQWLQFPSRLLGPATLGVALAAGLAVGSLQRRWRFITLVIVLLGLFICTSPFLFPRQQFVRFSNLTARKLQRFETASKTWGSAASQEFLPRWADPEFSTNPEAIQNVVRSAPVAISWRHPHQFRATSKTADRLLSGWVTIPVHYFPAWQLESPPGGLLEPDPLGLISVQLPAPVDQFEIFWDGTDNQKAGEWISLVTALVALILLLGMAATGRRQRPIPRHQGRTDSLSHKQFLAISGLLVLFWGTWWGLLHADNNPFRQTSPPDQVNSVQNAMHVTVGGNGQPTLIFRGWDQVPGKKSMYPGDEITVRLYWDVPQRIPQNLTSFVHLYTPQTKQSWVVGTHSQALFIPTTRWIPGLYYIEEHTLSLPPDLPPLTYTIVAGMIDEQGQRLKVTGNDEGLIYLGEIEINPLSARNSHLPPPDNRSPGIFDQSIKLVGYDLLPDPGGPILKLHWQPLERTEQDWTVFIHLVDRDQQIIAQYDAPPFNGLYPTSEWIPDTIIIDSKKLALPDNIGSGEYTILVGLYDPASGKRASVKPESGSETSYTSDSLQIPFWVP